MPKLKTDFMERLKALVATIRAARWNYAVVVLLLLCSLFYWYEWRPATIRIRCQKEMDLNVLNLKKINQKYFMINGVPEQERKSLFDKSKVELNDGKWNIVQNDYDKLNDGDKKWYEVESPKIIYDINYKSVSDADYNLCLRRHGLDAKWTYPKFE